MDSLWKKEPNGSYTDIFVLEDSLLSMDAVKKQSLLYQRLPTNTKNNFLEITLLKEGNKYFREGIWDDAMEYYNKSLSYAALGSSKIIWKTLNNRSKCFLQLKMYEQCLIDIQIAIESNYPEHLMPKLTKRRDYCYKKLIEDGGPVQFVPQLSYAANEHFPEMADVLEIEYNDEFGRHFVAKTDIDVGKTVILERMYSSIPLRTEFIICATCSKKQMNFIPCDLCTDEMFCDNNCKNSNDFHSFVEQEGDSSKNLKHKYQWLVNATKMFRSAEDLIEFVENALKGGTKEVPQSTTSEMSKFTAYLQLNVHVSPNRLSNLLSYALAEYNFIINLKSIKEMFRDDVHKNFLKHLIVHHTFVFCSNSYLFSHQNGLFLISSFFSHSCAPNLIFIECGNVMIGTILRPIKKGQQLFISYFEERSRGAPVDIRQDLLRREFEFECHCEKCENDDLPNISFLVSEPDYQFVWREMRKLLMTKNEEVVLHHKCIDLLNKFGDRQWHYELETVAMAYRTVLNQISN